MKVLSIKNLLNEAKLLLKSNSTTPNLDAELLLSYVLNRDRIYLFSYPELELTHLEYQRYQNLIEKRQQQVPIAYLVGQKEFWGMMLNVNEYTLIPRPETELLVELGLSSCRGEKSVVLDLGTGSGAIALAFAKEKPEWKIIAADISSHALNIARKNAEKQAIHQVTFIQSDWFHDIEGQFDMIVSNPPYLDINDPHLVTEEIRHEPRNALVSAHHGLADIENIIMHARHYLKPGACLLIEHGCDQGQALRDLFFKYRYHAIETFKDLNGLERVSRGENNSRSLDLIR